MVYVPKSKPRQTILINEKKLINTTYLPIKKPIKKTQKEEHHYKKKMD